MNITHSDYSKGNNNVKPSSLEWAIVASPFIFLLKEVYFTSSVGLCCSNIFPSIT